MGRGINYHSTRAPLFNAKTSNMGLKDIYGEVTGYSAITTIDCPSYVEWLEAFAIVQQKQLFGIRTEMAEKMAKYNSKTKSETILKNFEQILKKHS